MDIDTLIGLVSLLVALSIASERLVEIVKGYFSCLATQKEDPIEEGHRRAILHVLAVGAGLLTAWLASASIPDEFLGINKALAIVGLGLLASGGSGFWNAILAYLLNIKDIKKAKFREKQLAIKERDADLIVKKQQPSIP